MKKNKNSQVKNFNQYAKKDETGLFNGGYKASSFDTDIEKEDRRRNSTQEWLNTVDQYVEEYDYEDD